MNPKEFREALLQKREMVPTPFIPLIFSFAAKLRQISVTELFTNPTTFANSLRDAYKLFGYDALLNVFDPSLLAEALGCEVRWESQEKPPEVVSHPLASAKKIEDLDPEFEKRGRMPVVLEATKRLTMVMGKQVAIIGMVTGPLTLSEQLRGDSFLAELQGDSPYAKEVLDFAGKSSLKLTKLYCELNVDAVLFFEEPIGKVDDGTLKKVVPAFQSSWNVARYFGVPSLVLAHGCDENRAEAVGALGADGIILDVRSDLIKVREAAEKQNFCFAASLPTQVLLAEREQVRQALLDSLKKGRGGRGFFISNEWEVAFSTPPENVHEVMSVLGSWKP